MQQLAERHPRSETVHLLLREAEAIIRVDLAPRRH
jgi:hypothetical protein